MHRVVVWSVVSVLAVGGLPSARAVGAAADTQPNIVVIVADDLGFSDLGCYGGEIRTPHLDRLAAEGVRFSNFYTCGLCGPSRAALMTGLHPHQAGVTDWTGVLDARCTTLFEAVSAAGYATFATGRLDMITTPDWRDPKNLSRVLDRYLGTTAHQGPINYFTDVRIAEDYRDGAPYSIPPGGYRTDLCADFAVECLHQTRRERPFFVYLAHLAPHWPLQARPGDIAPCRERYRRLGWDAAREARLKRQIESGLVPPGTTLAARDPRVTDWEASAHQAWEAERMAVFAAQVECLDRSVGRVMDAIRRIGAERETLVIFLSDNGAADTEVHALDVPGRTWRRDGIPTRAGNDPAIPPGPADTFVTAGPAWSNVSNAPFRSHKQTAYEGGIASPLVVRWPAGVRRPGRICHAPTHITDVSATILDAAGVGYPAAREGRPLPPPAGHTLIPLLKEKPWAGHPRLCWTVTGHRAVREGSLKLVAAAGKPWELYDLSTDRSERHDLAAERPDTVAGLAAAHDAWSKR